MKIVSLFGTETTLKIKTSPHADVKDISTSTLTRQSDVSTGAVVAKPAKNTILTLNRSSLNSITGERKGIEIIATTEVAGY